MKLALLLPEDGSIVTPVVLIYIPVLANRRAVLGAAANGPVYKVASTVAVAALSAMSLLLLGQTLLGLVEIGG